MMYLILFSLKTHNSLQDNDVMAVFLKSRRSIGLYGRKIVMTGNISVHVCHLDRHEVLFHN